MFNFRQPELNYMTKAEGKLLDEIRPVRNEANVIDIAGLMVGLYATSAKT